MFAAARDGKDDEARAQIRLTLEPRQASLSTAVARLLVENNESEQQAAEHIGGIYDRVERQVYWFLAATLVAIALTSLYLIRSNRRLFARLAALSEQRSELAQKLIATQESTLRHISRELHDEFGQVLTAIGAMLARSSNHAPAGSPLRAELGEVSEVAQSALENVRGLSQALHPALLDAAGLESTIDWYLPTLARQTGVVIDYEKSGAVFPIAGDKGIHLYRVLQEAVNNAIRHSGAKRVEVRLRFDPDALLLEVEDRGKGLDPETEAPALKGIGMVAMRERAELLGGRIELRRPAGGGTQVHLRVPRERVADGA
jgi:signal transduction histidine kinase